MQSGLALPVVPAIFVLSTVAVPLDARAQGEATFFVSPRITGFEEVPTRFSPASGEFRATVAEDGGSIAYELTYSGFTTPVREAHIHLGARRVNGGIIIFLCANTGNAPANTPACPATEGTVTGTLRPEGVIGPQEQGIAPGEFEKLLAALRVGATYVNIHTEQAPAGEIRDQAAPTFRGCNGDDDDDCPNGMTPPGQGGLPPAEGGGSGAPPGPIY